MCLQDLVSNGSGASMNRLQFAFQMVLIYVWTAYHLCITKQNGLVCAGAEHFDLSVILRELYGGNWTGMIVQGLQ